MTTILTLVSIFFAGLFVGGVRRRVRLDTCTACGDTSDANEMVQMRMSEGIGSERASTVIPAQWRLCALCNTETHVTGKLPSALILRVNNRVTMSTEVQ